MKSALSGIRTRSHLLTFLFLMAFSSSADAAKVDTVLTRSASMKKDIKAVVILPDSYDGRQEYPVIYLLHGHGGSYSDYIKKIPAIKGSVDLHQVIIICPDGKSSWYLDSPVDKAWRYETYVATELPKWVDQNYKTIKDRKGRAIMGLSMGGHGALSLAIKHQDVFGAAGSMSGGLDLRPFPANWNIVDRLGSQSEYPERWKDNSVMEMVPLLSTKKLSLIIDCGESDFFYPVNKAFHEKLSYYNIPHDFIARPGAHNWDYWSNALQYQLLYFSRYFQGAKTGK